MGFELKWKVTYRLIAKGSDYVHNLIGIYKLKKRQNERLIRSTLLSKHRVHFAENSEKKSLFLNPSGMNEQAFLHLYLFKFVGYRFMTLTGQRQLFLIHFHGKRNQSGSDKPDQAPQHKAIKTIFHQFAGECAAG